MRVAIYGGSFNPIHKGHTTLANAICRMGLVDEVWLMISPLNPLKQGDQQHILPAFQRITLARIATAPFRRLHVSDFELTLPTPSYTATTLEYLEAVWPTHRFALLMGEDNWRSFHQWYRADYIRTHHPLIVYARPPGPVAGRQGSAARPDSVGREQGSAKRPPCLAKGLVTVHHPDGSVQTLNHPGLQLLPVSSTQIRQAIRSGDEPFLRQWLHAGVRRYILRHGLYRDLSSPGSETP